MNDLTRAFTYEGSQVRTLLCGTELMFVAKDVCEVLGYTWSGTKNIEHVPTQWRGVESVSTPSGIQQMAVLSEQGLYFFLGRSDKPKALPFQMWLAGEVVPAIRKHGGYLTPEKVKEALLDPDTIIQLATQLKVEREARQGLEVETAQQKQIISELRPKASYYDLILQSTELVPITLISKDYGMSGKSFNKLLNELGVQYNLHGVWLLYQGYAEQGYTQSKTHVIDAEKSRIHTYWTQKGRLFLYDLLKNKRGFLPLIEREAQSA